MNLRTCQLPRRFAIACTASLPHMDHHALVQQTHRRLVKWYRCECVCHHRHPRDMWDHRQSPLAADLEWLQTMPNLKELVVDLLGTEHVAWCTEARQTESQTLRVHRQPQKLNRHTGRPGICTLRMFCAAGPWLNAIMTEEVTARWLASAVCSACN
jgi:hypothetical protein